MLYRHAKEVFKSPFFIVGLLIRLCLVFFSEPTTLSQWFLPFFTNAYETGSLLQPWSAHLSQNGTPEAFPYGVVMYAAFLPMYLAGMGLSELGFGSAAGVHSFLVTLFLVDLFVLLLLYGIKPLGGAKLMCAYWLSPVLLYVTYWHVQFDLVPVGLLIASLVMLQKRSFLASGALLGTAVSAKLSMLIAAPFILVFLLANKHRQQHAATLVGMAVLVTSALYLPTIVNPAAVTMIFGSPELLKVFDLAVVFQNGLTLFLLPILYVSALYFSRAIQRLNIDLLFSLVGLVFVMVALLSPASPGWFLWGVPFLAVLIADRNSKHLIYLIIFGFTYVVMQCVMEGYFSWLNVEINKLSATTLDVNQLIASLAYTLLFGIGATMFWQILKDSIFGNDFFRISRRPILIGISGDSGTGKDTLAESLCGIFGHNAVSHVSGDDYHLWDRQKPMWQVMTHLNPQANNLQNFKKHILRLCEGESILNPHYDHATGQMTKPKAIHPNDVIISSGLHALSDPELRRKYNLSVFLDMDESLRLFLKLRRDVSERGHEYSKVVSSMEFREGDRQRFILPQRSEADLVIRLAPATKIEITEAALADPIPRFVVSIIFRQSLPVDDLMRGLIGLLGVNASVEVLEQGAATKLDAEGRFSEDDLEALATHLLSDVRELMKPQPLWQTGLTGLISVCVVWALENRLRDRRS